MDGLRELEAKRRVYVRISRGEEHVVVDEKKGNWKGQQGRSYPEIWEASL